MLWVLWSVPWEIMSEKIIMVLIILIIMDYTVELELHFVGTFLSCIVSHSTSILLSNFWNFLLSCFPPILHVLSFQGIFLQLISISYLYNILIPCQPDNPWFQLFCHLLTKLAERQQVVCLLDGQWNPGDECQNDIWLHSTTGHPRNRCRCHGVINAQTAQWTAVQ